MICRTCFKVATSRGWAYRCNMTVVLIIPESWVDCTLEFITLLHSTVWWPIYYGISAPRMGRQKALKVKATLGNTARPCFKKFRYRLGTIPYAYNLRHSRGREQEDHSLREPGEKVSETPPHTIKLGMVACACQYSYAEGVMGGSGSRSA
jgi:hypothetical protein